MNKKLSLLMLALAVVALIIYLVTGYTLYLVLAGINLCSALAGLFNSRIISLIFMLLGTAGIIYIFILMIKVFLA